MKPDKIYQGEITRFDAKGRGVFDLTLPNQEVRPMAVPFAFPGDTIETQYTGRKLGVYAGRLNKIITPSSERVAPPMPGLEQYPGAPWLCLNYSAQLIYKRDMINQAFEQAGHAERINAVESGSKLSYYRNRMDYSYGWRGELGLRQFGFWHKYFNVTHDILLSAEATPILEVCRDLLPRFNVVPWDHQRNCGDLRYVVIREGKFTGERLIALIVKDLTKINADTRDYLKTALDPYATSLILGENSLLTDSSYAQKLETLKGREYLTENINGLNYQIHLNSFFQTNSLMAGRLQQTVADLAGMINRLLDLYCGLGFFGIYLAKQNPELKVFGFEIDAPAIELAKQNALMNNVGAQCSFTAGPAEDLTWQNIETDLVIIDPPRAGLHPRVIATLLDKQPATLIYVSCNYHRLVQELKEFKKAYKITALQALDLFPHTPHVETVVRLDRQT
jgi:23S rRNA (uracil-5-)-methyltransferase RumA